MEENCFINPILNKFCLVRLWMNSHPSGPVMDELIKERFNFIKQGEVRARGCFDRLPSLMVLPSYFIPREW